MSDGLSRELKRVFFNERLNQPEIFEIILHPDNLNYVLEKSGLTGRVGTSDFLNLSIDILQSIFREPYRAYSLERAITQANSQWVEYLMKRFAPSGATDFYKMAAKNSFVGQPNQFTPPVSAGIKGSRILVLDQPGFTDGKAESEEIRY
jgi:hypothetical protein